LGFIVNQPIRPCRYDFVIDLGTKFIKVQCKTSHLADTVGKAIMFSCQSTRNAKTGRTNRVSYTKDEIDYFYTCWEGQGYLVPVNQCSDSKTLRFEAKTPIKTMCWASDYEIEKILEKELEK